LGLGLTLSGHGQQFINLDFESPQTADIMPDGIWVSWSLAAPGWTHPKGGDSVFVYHNTPPSSSIAQFYFLADSASTKWSPLEGDFSLALVSGHYNRLDQASPWVKAYIEQEGIIPEGTKSLQLLAKGEFSLTLDSKPVTVAHVGGDQFLADVSEFSGEYATLRISNESTEVQRPVIVDGLQFVTQPIPEPGVGALMLSGLAVMGLRRKFTGRLKSTQACTGARG
jgi:hypothetical protein